MIGTRPEAIKLAPLATALDLGGISLALIFTGQHELDPADYGLGRFPAVRLNCRGRIDPREHARAVAAGVASCLGRLPDLLVVQGDTSTALGGALAAVAATAPLAHVEAGLRTHDLSCPWPEEEFRIEIDRLSDLLFAPTELNARNLHREGVPGEVHVTGNTGIDAVLDVASRLTVHGLSDNHGPRLLVTCHRRESWGEGLASISRALLAIADLGLARIDCILHPNPAISERLSNALGNHHAIHLHSPRRHEEILEMMRQATLVLSDSGGLQEEAPALGVPLLVLRDKTERPEALASGNSELVGTDDKRIVAAVTRLLGDPMAIARMAQPALPYGDGKAAGRIATIISSWLHERAEFGAARESAGFR